MKKIILNNGLILQEGKKYYNKTYGKEVGRFTLSHHGNSDFMKTIPKYKYLTIDQILRVQGEEIQIVFNESFEKCSKGEGNGDIRGCFSYSKEFLENYLSPCRRFEI
jgi:hypothetical protein